MRVATASARSDSDGGNSLADRDIRVGGGKGEVGASPHKSRRLYGRLNQRMLGRSLSAGPRPDCLDLHRERSRSNRSLVVFLFRGRLGDAMNRPLQLI